jgi:cAMP-binding proteins - catabolite gene activator and regulatory subunit of cAMP-dependent protein kinases
MHKIANSSNIKLQRKAQRKSAFDAKVFLDTSGAARKVIEFKKAEVVYSQGDAAKSIMYLQAGGIKLSVVNEVGKEAVVAILEPGDFFGEGCLAGQPVRMGRLRRLHLAQCSTLRRVKCSRCFMSSMPSPTAS